MKNEINRRLEALRAEMREEGIGAYYITGTDPHASEYLPERWQTRAFISGFTGSYGVLAITQNRAALWTDSRYFIQAAEQLEDTGIEMMKLRVPDAIPPETWFAENLEPNSKVGVDTETLSFIGYQNLKQALAKNNIALVDTPDLLDRIWENRPLASEKKIFELDLETTGLSRKEKQQQVVNKLQKIGAKYALISMLDELAWLYNLRGSDIRFNPVFTGFGLIGENENYLFIDSKKVDANLKENLEKDSIVLKDYAQFYTFLSTLSEKKIFIDPSTINYAAYSRLALNNEFLQGTSIVSLLKSRKNTTELNGFRDAMQKDGVALVKFLYWLKKTIREQELSEYDIALKLKEFRAKQVGFVGESFAPIVGYKSHGAIVHFSVTKQTAFKIKTDGILLFDSGGQYLNGTTDITRTIALGKPTEQEKKDYTLVLKGMIALSNAKFPYGTRGCNIDILARQALWNEGLNYGHGTGHGVGHFLNVHEGPMAIRQDLNENLIEPGNVISNEPGLYREGLHGIRIENLIVCIEKEKTEFGQFLGFETLTLCPIDTRLIKNNLLTEKEKNWLNNYHKKVNKALKPLLKRELQEFLSELTKEI